MLLFSSQFLIPQGELEPVSGRPVRWECHWLSASPPNLTARRQESGDLLYWRERRGVEGESENEGKDERGKRKKRDKRAGGIMWAWRQRREHDKAALTLYLSMNTLWFSVCIRFKDGFTLHTLTHYTEKWGSVPLSLLCVVCQHGHWSRHSVQRAVSVCFCVLCFCMCDHECVSDCV